MTELEKAIECLYSTFARYPRPERIEFCPCGCTAKDATNHLITTALRELREKQLEDFAFSSMTTQGSVDDFRYLLPRLFEVVSQCDLCVDPEILFGKLEHAKWLNWPPDEITAIRTYLRALWQTALSVYPLQDALPAFFEIETVLASIARTGEPFESYLQTWTKTTTQQADEHLIQLVTFYGSDFSDDRTLHEAFWEESKPQAEALRNWLLQPETLQRIASAAHLLKTDGYEHLFPPALEILQREGRTQS